MPAGLWPRVANFAYDSTRSQIVLFGGYNGAFSDDTWTWNSSQWSRRTPTSSPSARLGAAITDDPDHHVVVLFGGVGSGGDLGDTWLWNGVDWRQVNPAHNPSPRRGAALTYDAVRHLVVLFGGSDLGDTWVWDGTDWAQKTPANSPPGRMYGRIAFDAARGKAVLYGGFQLHDTWTWDGSSWTDAQPANEPPPMSEATPFPDQMVYDAAWKVIVFVDIVGHSGETIYDTAQTWTWDGTTWTRMKPATAAPVRYNYGLAYDASRSVTVLAGGWPQANANGLATWGWNGATWSRLAGTPPAPSPVTTPTPSSPTSGLWPRLTTLAYDSTRHEVLLHGCYVGRTTDDTRLADTWVWDGHAWAERLSVANPSANCGVALADDPDHHVVVLFGGGANTKILGETWLWNGSAWKQAFPAHSPPPRAGAAMTFDPVHHDVILFGGFNPGLALNDTWVWDGSDWTEKTPPIPVSTVSSGTRSTSPPYRYDARLAFDVARGNAVLYGGFQHSDTWTWDGSAWTEKHPTNNPPFLAEVNANPEQMAYDPVHKVIVFAIPTQHSSQTADDTMDTWAWNGSNWSRLDTPASPPIRFGYGLTYDQSRSVMVYAGGTFNGADENSTWGWNGVTWSKIG